MRHEIGSFYEEETIQESYENNIFKTIENLYYFSCGRDAISACLNSIQKEKEKIDKVCILPMYTCDSVIIPFKNKNWTIYYYDIKENLVVEQKSLEALIDKVHPSVIFMHTYYGVDTISEVRNYIWELQKKEEIIFIEDVTQSLGFINNKSTADYLLGSLRKWFPIQDGGFVKSKYNIANPQKYREDFCEIKKRAQKIKANYLKEEIDNCKEEFLMLNNCAEQLLYADENIYLMSKFAKQSLLKLDVEKNLSIRNRNGKILENEIKGMHFISTVVDSKEDTSFLFFPIYVENRKELQDYLKVRNIYAPILWPIYEELENEMSSTVEYIYNNLLAIPCDQRYDEKDMLKIIECLKSYERLKMGE